MLRRRQKQVRIGTRLPTEIAEDPTATLEEILSLPQEAALIHPNVPLDYVIAHIEGLNEEQNETKWLAALVIEQNPSFPLWELESPQQLSELWFLASQHLIDQIGDILANASGPKKCFYICETAAMSLGEYEQDPHLTSKDRLIPRTSLLAQLVWCLDPTLENKRAARRAQIKVTELMDKLNVKGMAEHIEFALQATQAPTPPDAYDVMETVREVSIPLCPGRPSRALYLWSKERMRSAEILRDIPQDGWHTLAESLLDSLRIPPM